MMIMLLHLNLIGNTVADGTNGKKEGVKIVVPIKYLSNFWRSLEIPLINCRVELSLSWNENCILSSAGTAATFTITDTKLYVRVVTLKTEDNTKLSKVLREGFKRSVYWNKYKVIPNKIYNENDYIRELLDASHQRVKRLFILAYDNAGNDLVTADSHRKDFLPRMKIIILKSMEETFMISNSMKLEKYQQDKVIIIQLDAY